MNLFKSSTEISQLIENLPLNNDSYFSSKELQKKISIDHELISKQKNLNSELHFQNILNQMKGVFDSTQGSENINERSSLNFISEIDFAKSDDDDDDIFNHESEKSFERQSLETPVNSKNQILSYQNTNTEFINYNQIEERIYCWLDQQGIKQVSPIEKQDNYYEQKKKIVSTHIFSIKSLTDIPDDSKPTIRKQSLLQRRKQQNLNLRKTTMSPSSCIDLEHNSFTFQQDVQLKVNTLTNINL